jgi:hypothetical protein
MRAFLVAATIATVHTPTLPADRTEFPVIDASGARVVWSDYRAGAWHLMERSGALGVAGRARPFDVDLGPDGHGGTLAVYSRRGRLYEYSFRTARERPLGLRGRWPAVWGSRIAYVRGGRPYWRAHGHSHRLRVPRVRGRSIVSELDMRGRAVVYTWQAVGRFDTWSFIDRATTGGSLRAVSRGAYVAGGDASSVKSVGQAALGADGADWLYRDDGHADLRAAFLRAHGTRASGRSTAVAFAHAGRTAYWIDAGPRAEAQPGGAFPLHADEAITYRPAPRSYLRLPRCGVRRICRPL